MNLSDSLHHNERLLPIKIKEILQKYPVPPHLQPPSTELPLGRLRNILFKILCLCAYGQPDLKLVWAAIKLEEEGDASEWREKQRKACEQLNNLIVVVRYPFFFVTKKWLNRIGEGGITVGHISCLYDNNAT